MEGPRDGPCQGALDQDPVISGNGLSPAIQMTDSNLLIQNMDIFLLANVLEYFRPYGDTDLSKVCFLKYKHEGAGLAYATTYAERYLVVYYCLVVWELEEIKLSGNL